MQLFFLIIFLSDFQLRLARPVVMFLEQQVPDNVPADGCAGEGIRRWAQWGLMHDVL